MFGLSNYYEVRQTCRQIQDGMPVKPEVADFLEGKNNSYVIEAACKNFRDYQLVYNHTLERTKSQAIDKLTILRNYLPNMAKEIDATIRILRDVDEFEEALIEAIGNSRTKRFIGMVTGLVNLAISGVRLGLDAYSTYKLKTRLKALFNEINRLDGNTFRLHKAQVKLSHSMNALAIATRDGFRELRSNLDITNERLNHLSEAIQLNMLEIRKLGRETNTLTYTTSVQYNQMLALNSLNDMSYQYLTLFRQNDSCITFVTARHASRRTCQHASI